MPSIEAKKTTEILENLKKREEDFIEDIALDCPDCDEPNIFFQTPAQKTGSIVVEDKNNKQFEISLTEDKENFEIFALEKGISSSVNDTIGDKNFTQKDIDFQRKLIEELKNDIKEKLNPNNFTNEERRYAEGALKHLDFLKFENVLFEKSIGKLSTGLYNGKLNINYPENSSKDDIKITLFHEYLHHVNYMEKIYPYRYKDESRRVIFSEIDNCYSFEELSMDEILDDYIAYQILNDSNFNDTDWQYKKYNTLNLAEKRKIDQFRKENEYKYNEKKCNRGQYKPSNYFKDEITVYKICFSLNNVIFKMSSLKYANYVNNLSDYEILLLKSKKYEQKNNYRPTGIKK